MTNSEPTFVKHSSEPTSSNSRGVGVNVLLRAIAFYQQFTSGRPSPCRFYPSCSNYAREAIEVHGAIHGTGLAIRRVSRCRPLGPHGVDLVPESRRKIRSPK